MYLKHVILFSKPLSVLKYSDYINKYRYLSTLRKSFPSMSEKEIRFSLQRLRQAKRAKLEKFSPSYATLQILGSGIRGTPSCLYVSTDHSKYLFNCGEGTQRLAHEHHLRLTKLEHVFFTTPTWRNMGGLPGMCLTIQDSGVPQIDLHGPTGIGDIFECVKRFVLLTNLNVTEANCQDNEVYEDACMTVRYVHLKKAHSDSDSDTDESVMADDTDYYSHEVNRNGKRKSKWQRPSPEVPTEVHPPLGRKVSGCIAYICKLTPKAGALNLEKCVEKGVTPGPVLGKLKSGENVTLDDGTVILSSEVCDPPIFGPVFIVLECPDEDYLDSLIGNETFKEYQSGAEKENIAYCIIHFSPETIMCNPRYIEWMKKFPSSTQHVIINESNHCMNYEALHRIQHKLHLLHPTIFPMLCDKNDKGKSMQMLEKINETEHGLYLRIYRAKTLNAIHLRPLGGLDTSMLVKTNRKVDVDEVLQIDGFLDTLAELQTEINARSKAIKDLPEYPKILMLGTGSSIPNKVRNTSGILLRIDKDTSVLLDCGEGTLGQLIRFYGSQTDKVLSTIKAIFVSHLHADHHLGFLGVLQERKRVTDDTLFLLAPKQIESWLRLYHKKFEHIENDYILVPNQGILFNARKLADNVYDDLNEKMNIQSVNTAEVVHCAHSFGVSVTLKNGKKIVYSGDTRPCLGLVNLGQDCDLLIHEATMESALEEEAKKKMHSTTLEAVQIGQKMNAKFTLLTHFSQRYSKMPRLPEDTDEMNFTNVGIAFDNMHFSLSELTLLPLFYPSLKLMFNEFCNILEEKAQKRVLRENR